MQSTNPPPAKVEIVPGTFRCELCKPPVLVKIEDRHIHRERFHKVIPSE